MSDQQFNALTAPNANDQAIANDTTFYVKKIPSQIAVSPELLKRGQERFNIYCSPCHGAAGEGDGMVVQRGFPKPPSYHTQRLRAASAQHFFDVITKGYGVMYAYADRVAPADRWAIAAYIRALQLSHYARLAEVPDAREHLP
jgi:mono/diheme cytochrome c family protein